MPNNKQLEDRTTDTAAAVQGWTGLQRQEGTAVLQWLAREERLSRGFDRLAQGLREIFEAEIRMPADARHVWDAASSVLGRCNDPATYSLAGADKAYAWLHLLDRYVRTWVALERLLREGMLPMGQHGVRVLDVGTGPGPSAFATHDFYVALTDYSGTSDNELWSQPPDITCVERAGAMNRFRHRLSEVLFASQAPGSIFEMVGGLDDFERIRPREERRQLERQLRDSNDEWHDGEEWHAEPTHTAEEANYEANAHRRYRFFAFSNFLTTLDMLDKSSDAILDILSDARPGSVVLVLGGKGGDYPEIGRRVGELAQTGGFRRSIACERVASRNAGLEERLAEELRWLYTRLRRIAGNLPAEDLDTKGLRDVLEGRTQVKFGSSAVNAFRK